MAWVYLAMAAALEIVWAFFLKQSGGFTRLVPSLVTGAAMIASIAFLALSMRSLPLGAAYMIWTGIGAVGTFLLGILVLGEPASALRVTAACLIGSGVVLMKAAT